MDIRLTDEEIEKLLLEPKQLPKNYREIIITKVKRGHKESEIQIRGELGLIFILKIRQSIVNTMDFSVILSYLHQNSSIFFRLRRYNGKSHEHSNKLEGSKFYDYHIHTATERYQNSGFREDSFAEPTDRYASLEEAIHCMFNDCGFIKPTSSQVELFNEEV